MDILEYLFWILVWTGSILCTQVNVALYKNTSTTSGIYIETEGLTWDPAGAVDGDHDTLNSSLSCFHSLISPADWTVDLGQRYQLYKIIVYIREKFERRTANSIIYVDKDQTRVCYNFPSNIFNNPTYLTCNETARYVTIRNPGEKGIDADSLNICEVEIYACTGGYRGLDCNLDCHCDKCDRWTGICNSTCRPGWEGEKCDKACNRSYGSNCNNSCDARHCSNISSSCDPVKGTCDPGCLPGWTGHDCITECPRSTYGLHCSQNCTNRHCMDNSTCDHVTGSCDLGCEPGWTSTDCMEACNRTYGSKCNNFCDARHCSNSSSSCDPVKGTCDPGCLAGWIGHNCITECHDSTYGHNCYKKCEDRHCLNNSTCDHVTGSCDLGCESGWKSKDCTEECMEGEEFGPNCSGSCNARHCLNQSSCDPVYGVCENGCETGWEGLPCLRHGRVSDVTADPKSPTPDAGTITFSTTVGVLVTIIVILAVFLIRVKLKQRFSTDANKTPPDPSPTTDNIFTDITSSNTDSSTTPSNYETLQPAEDSLYTGLKGRNLYENI